MSAAEGARSCIGEGVSGLGGEAGLCSSAMCAFGGIARGGGWGFCRGFVCSVSSCVFVGGSDSEVEGRLSVICITNALFFPGGDNIPNSGKPDGGSVVYRALPLRAGPFFLNDDIVGNICRALSEAMTLDMKDGTN